MIPHRPFPAHQRGQVLVIGVFIMVILLLAFFAGFDIYNAIRAKFKVETAHEAAALAGAHWQKESLNLIGEINIIKACSLLLEGDDKWDIPLPVPPANPANAAEINQFRVRRREALQARLDILTEMQARVSFVGPLIGFAAAQQAAKANGLQGNKNLASYIDLLENNYRYRRVEHVNNYAWRIPYISFLKALSSAGIAVIPNVRSAGSLTVYPPELKSKSFYAAIYTHQREIDGASGKAIPYSQASWRDLTHRFVYRDEWKGHFDNPPWWYIDPDSVTFPGESEIFALGVAASIHSASAIQSYNGARMDSGEWDFQVQKALMESAKKRNISDALRSNIYKGTGRVIPEVVDEYIPNGINMKFFCYDYTWYPAYYLAHFGDDYKEYHYEYWFKKDPLRKDVKPQYVYEGPAAYVEGSVRVGRTTSMFRVTGQRRYNYDNHTKFGSRREDSVIMAASGYRPGAIAKALGELDNERPPIDIPLVLPVFNKVSIMPTYMPIPYGFSVLTDGDSALESFLYWLSTQKNLENSDPQNPLPPECEYFLEALRILVQDKEFRYYGWNPGFDDSKFHKDWADKLPEWHKKRLDDPDKYQYSLKGDRSLPGFLQEPQLFPTGIAGKGEVKCPDNINGGTATRIYYDTYSYFVIDGTGKIVTNNDVDPTLNYSTPHVGGSGSGITSDGMGYDDQKGPPRL